MEGKKLAMGIQLLEHLTAIYHNIYNEEDNEHVTDYENLSSRFSKKYGSQPEFFIRVPGLLYLFGEDPVYAQYDQCNIAIEQDIVIAYSKNKSNKDIIVNSLSSTSFPEKIFNFESNFIDQDELGNVALLGIKSAIEDQKQESLCGVKCMFSNKIPVKQTLHSKNALAIGMCIMMLHANKINIDCKTVLNNFQKYKKVVNVPPSLNEQYQKMILFAQKNEGYVGDTSQSLQIPKGFTFILANSLTPEPKMLVAAKRKNKRICEQRLAVHIMLSNMEIQNREGYSTLLDIQKLLDFKVEDMPSYIHKYIENKAFKKEEIEAIIGTDMINIMQDIPYSNQVIEGNTEFFPYKRAIHIVNEAIKAQKMKQICSDQSLNDQQKWEQIFQLFNESQQSIIENLEAQSEECSKLIKLMKELGCKSTKVIGDGWGGSVIGIVEESKADKIIEFIMDGYYSNKDNKLMVSDDLNNYVFKSLPSRGACILNPEYEIWF
ncbi:galactokinase (macronuclear) [Tetrahymena thermophila SB210]|uniref:Galactokinase n=1 Tax=Tetrahymena thermophila (strain SB210) TaxID=312017 RepID=Q22GF3_TETTS|nr:galactokinase [Tetrahymena thermophila SB210]EAR84378.2 galactokinase [Tetrahymena thermophila SB210]|eukprot:XP_001032041.2 galactokinase [Tetrahymena thermophila SB210]